MCTDTEYRINHISSCSWKMRTHFDNIFYHHCLLKGQQCSMLMQYTVWLFWNRKPVKQSRQSSRGKSCKRPLPITTTHEHTKEEIEKDKLLKKQSVMHFSSLDSVEARFPEVSTRPISLWSSWGPVEEIGGYETLRAVSSYGNINWFSQAKYNNLVPSISETVKYTQNSTPISFT